MIKIKYWNNEDLFIPFPKPPNNLNCGLLDGHLEQTHNFAKIKILVKTKIKLTGHVPICLLMTKNEHCSTINCYWNS